MKRKRAAKAHAKSGWRRGLIQNPERNAFQLHGAIEASFDEESRFSSTKPSVTTSTAAPNTE